MREESVGEINALVNKYIFVMIISLLVTLSKSHPFQPTPVYFKFDGQ